MVEADYQVKSPFVFKDNTARLSGIRCPDDRVEFFDIDSVTCYLAAIVFDNQLRKSHRLFYNYVCCSRNFFYIGGSFFCPFIEFVGVFTVQLDGNICFRSCHQLVEAELYRL